MPDGVELVASADAKARRIAEACDHLDRAGLSSLVDRFSPSSRGCEVGVSYGIEDEDDRNTAEADPWSAAARGTSRGRWKALGNAAFNLRSSLRRRQRRIQSSCPPVWQTLPGTPAPLCFPAERRRKSIRGLRHARPPSANESGVKLKIPSACASGPPQSKDGCAVKCCQTHGLLCTSAKLQSQGLYGFRIIMS